MELPIEITHLIDNNEIDAAIVAVSDLIASFPDDASLYYERGKLYWRTECRRKAINDYVKAVDLDSASPAAEALRQAMAIMQFYDKSRYNP